MVTKNKFVTIPARLDPPSSRSKVGEDQAWIYSHTCQEQFPNPSRALKVKKKLWKENAAKCHSRLSCCGMSEVAEVSVSEM